jgi:acetyl-CoA carboxylase beta subunit
MMKTKTSKQQKAKALNIAHVTSSATDNNWRKCKHCGKFISYRQMEEYKDVMFHFIPDSEITTEEAYWVHRHCR